jgi:hypothetical protein
MLLVWALIPVSPLGFSDAPRVVVGQGAESEGSINILPGCGQSYDVALSRTERRGRQFQPRRTASWASCTREVSPSG